jgi:streptogramin lyase
MKIPGSNYNVAIGGDGSVWVTTASNSVVRLSALGAPLNTIPLGFFPENIVIDAQGRGWISSDLTVSAYTPAGAALPGSPFTQPNISTTDNFRGMAVDKIGNIWVGDRSIYIFTSTGAAASFSPIVDSARNPWSFAVDSSGTIWNNDEAEHLYGYTSAGASTANAGYSCGLESQTIAFDANNNAWMAVVGGICKVSESGVVPVGFPYAGIPYSNSLTSAVVLDGANQAWGVATAFMHLANDGTVLNPSSGIGAVFATTQNLFSGVAPDGSGNVWSNYSDTNTLVELVGAATPIVTPKVANLLAPYGSSAVNKP